MVFLILPFEKRKKKKEKRMMWHHFIRGCKERVLYGILNEFKIFQVASDWLHLYPRGFRKILLYAKKKYHDPLIFITENGKFFLELFIYGRIKLWY